MESESVNLTKKQYSIETRKSFASAAASTLSFQEETNKNRTNEQKKLADSVKKPSPQFQPSISGHIMSNNMWPELPKPTSFQRHESRLKSTKIISASFQDSQEVTKMKFNQVQKFGNVGSKTNETYVLKKHISGDPMKVQTASSLNKIKENGRDVVTQCDLSDERKKSTRNESRPQKNSVEQHKSSALPDYMNEPKKFSSQRSVVYEEESSSNTSVCSKVTERKVETIAEKTPESENSSVQRRTRQRKKVLKEEKKRVQEEEARRKIVAPKGQSVRLVSQKMLVALLNCNAESVSVQNVAPSMNELEFPTVQESRKQRVKLADEHEIVSTNVEQQETQAGNSCDRATEGLKVPTRNKKRKDPIHVDLFNLIKTQPSRQKVRTLNKVQKRDSTVRYGGNQLDASNPERKRGKRKEVPKKKKITILKSAILEARTLKRHLKELQAQAMSRAAIAACPIDSLAASNEIMQSDIVPERRITPPESEEVKSLLHAASKTKATNIVHEVLELAQNMEDGMCLGGNASCPQTRANTQETVTDKITCDPLPLRLPVHSRKFREYCDHSVTAPLNDAVRLLLKDIVKFQDRQYQRDPIKAFAKRRYVSGFREVKKFLQLKKLKLIIIAPDLEVAKSKGGIDDTVAELKEAATVQGMRYLFALSRRELGFLTFKKVGVSCIGICNYEGSEDNFVTLVESLVEAQKHYEEQTGQVTTKNVELNSTEDEPTSVNDQVIASLLLKLAENSSELSGTSPFLSAIEKEASIK